MPLNIQQKRRLRIAMVCDPVTDFKAGSLVSTLRFAELLSKNGHTVIFIAARSDTHPNHDYHNDTIKAYRFFSILPPMFEKGFRMAFPRKSQLIKIFRDEKIDIVHILIPHPSAITATRAAKALGMPILTHSHTQPENLFLHLPHFPGREKLNTWFYHYLNWLYGQADAIVYPTEFAKLPGDLKLSLQHDVISNGVDTSVFKTVAIGDFLERHKVPSGKVRILYVGRLHPEKNLPTLVNALPHIIEQFPNAHLMFVGSGNQRQKLEVLVQTLGMREYVTFLGKVSDDDLVLAYNAGDIFILPSLAELEGMVVLEAMACGKPVIVADSPLSAAPTLVNGNGLLFRADDHTHLAEQMVTLLKDEALREQMAARSLEEIQKYDLAVCVAKLEKLYFSLLK